MFDSAPNRKVPIALILVVAAIVAIIMLGFLGSVAKLPFVAAILVFFVAMSVAFVRGTDGLYLVIFAMLFSPEIASGITTGRATGEGAEGIVLRLEDIIMIAVALGWVFRSAYTRHATGIVRTPVNATIWIYMAASVIATLLGVLNGHVIHFSAGFFHNLKYFEYFLLFFMILAHVRGKDTLIRMINAMFIVFLLSMLYGYTQMGTQKRVCAPFDAEPNTFGGYIVLLMCVAAGVALADSRTRSKAAMVALILIAIPPLLFTLSRASYLALVVATCAFLAVSKHRILIGAAFLALIAALLLGFPMLPDSVQERVAGTFQVERPYHVQIAGIDFDASSSARLIAYRQGVQEWVRSPLFGYGVTGTYFMDAQLPRILVETGIVGLLAFLFMIWRLLREVYRISVTAADPFLKGAATGFFCGTIALLAHALGANSFIIIRIAEPFWLLAGLILLVPRVEEESRECIAQEEPTPNDQMIVPVPTR